MAHKKAGGSSRNGRDSQSKRLGVKVFGGQGMIPQQGLFEACAAQNPALAERNVRS